MRLAQTSPGLAETGGKSLLRPRGELGAGRGEEEAEGPVGMWQVTEDLASLYKCFPSRNQYRGTIQLHIVHLHVPSSPTVPGMVSLPSQHPRLLDCPALPPVLPHSHAWRLEVPNKVSGTRFSLRPLGENLSWWLRQSLVSFFFLFFFSFLPFVFS